MRKSKPALCLAALLILTACGSTTEETIQPPAALQDGAQSAPQETTAPIPTDATLAEQVLFSDGGVTVTALSLEEDLLGPVVNISTTNDSSKNLIITAQSLSVNGYMMPSASLYCEVAAGKKANDELNILASEMEEAGIETISQIDFSLQISDAETYETVAESGLLTLKTSLFGSFTQAADDSGREVYSQDGIRVVCKGLKQDVIWDGTVVFFLENKSDLPVTVYAENVSVNGYMADVSLWTDLRPGTRAVDGMYLMNLESIELSSLDDIQNVEFSLRIIHSKDFTDIDSTDPISLDF